MKATTTDHVTIIDVGPRDGFQGITPFIPTAVKIDYVRRLAEAGVTRIEVGSFVNPAAVPQLRDTAEVFAACHNIPNLHPQILVPNVRYGTAAIEAGVKFLAFVISVSEPHNRNNVRRHPLESAEEYAKLIAACSPDVDVRLNLATAFDCPFAGNVAEQDVLDLLERLIVIRPDAEICLCDTTGKATPDHVERLFGALYNRFPKTKRWAFHAHDTYGLGLADVYAAWRCGVRIFDAAFAGLGGCPFAPGATGNVATEDVVWMFSKMGIATGVDLDKLIPIACDGAAIPGGGAGGRVRSALAATRSATCNL